MNGRQTREYSYFPGCSVVSTAWESNQSLTRACESLDFNLVELEDWNCCGSSSAFAIDPELGFNLSARNLSLADPRRPLLVMCPRCLHHLRETHQILRQDRTLRRAQERRWRRPISPDLEIIHFLEAVVKLEPRTWKREGLNGLKFMPYYGCTLYRPPALRRERYYQGEVENVLAALGGVPVVKALTNRCCGSFLSAVRPHLVSEMVNQIIQSAQVAGAECLVTVCAMCQLNLEIRCTLENKLPIFHFSEVLALALEARDYESWFARHLVDPHPLLLKRGLLR